MSAPGQPRPLTPQEQARLEQTMSPWEANPCLALPQLRTALYRLMAGDSRSKVMFAGSGTHRESVFHPGDVKILRSEISRLTIQCDPDLAHGRAVRAGPTAPNGTFGWHRNPFRYW